MESSPGSRWLPTSRLRWAGPSREDMAKAPVTAATGALGPVITKLAALLGSEYKLRWHTRRDVKFIRSKLKPVHSILWNIWEREELDAEAKELKMGVLDLADDVDDAIVDFILSLERSRSNKRLVQTKIKASPFQDFKKRASDVSGRCRSKWEGKEKPTDDNFSRSKPRAYPYVRKDASELVDMAEPMERLIQNLVGEEEGTPVELCLKTAAIYGIAGMGKTTLADVVYEKIGNKFQSRAFVSVPPSDGNMREILARILQQVADNSSVPLAGTEASREEHLIDIISTFLKDKRYLVIIDDIWNWREWKVIMKSLPENNLGSRIMGTTRIKAVAEKWSVGPKKIQFFHEMLPKWASEKGWVYQIGEEDIATRMVAMKVDLAAEGFDNKHPIVRMCGGTPLALCCMLSAVAEEREKQGQQGLRANACDVQDKIEKHVMENGIQNTPGFEPLVESLQLDYDSLPHHMLKTCLLYCSIYPEGHIFDRYNLVRRWISEGFVYNKEEANGYFEELVNRGFIMRGYVLDGLRMHPMVQNFLRTKSRPDNFITCSSEITSSYICRIRRLCIYNLSCRSTDAAWDPLFEWDWYKIRSLIVYEDLERVPFEKLEGVRVLDLCQIRSLLDHHLKNICGLVRLRHLLGFLQGDGISELPPEIARLQCLETFEVCGKGFTRLPGFIGNLQQLKTLRMTGTTLAELPREIGALRQLKTLEVEDTPIKELPREIGSLQQLETMVISHTSVTVLPKEIGSLQQLKTLEICRTPLTQLPKEIGKLHHLEHLLMSDTRVAKIPREIGALKELKSLEFGYSIVALPLEVCALVELPECIQQAVNTSGLVSKLAREMLSFERWGLVVGAKQMHIPQWIREHFNELQVLDIRICKLEEGGLKILREMPKLVDLTLRFEVVPREPVVISSEGFVMLENLTIDSRIPRVTFQEGAMPMLQWLTFRYQFYSGPPNNEPVGINHLRSLRLIDFECNEDWYPGGDNPCIARMIDVVKKETGEPPNLVNIGISGNKKEVYRRPPPLPPRRPPSIPSPLEMGQQHELEEEEEEERSSGVGEIEENIQA